MDEMARRWIEVRARITIACSGDRGASLVEYALLLALITVVCVAAVAFIGESTGESLSSTASELDG